ncbi:hypothetical protein [Saccharopolyspora hattusasensis]|uniref:hypothetical protein n=1 Tax=Saccharopolyspora hattusasensis TaxID=1128679 RepID=UPI003D96D24A
MLELCVTARCDDCGDLYGAHVDGVVHFRTAVEAAKEITTPYHDELTWVVGDNGRLRCDVCEARRWCGEYGHDWSKWLHVMRQDVAELLTYRMRFCSRCPETETTGSTGSKEVTA